MSRVKRKCIRVGVKLPQPGSGRTGPGFGNGFGASQGYLIARPSVLVSAGQKKQQQTGDGLTNGQ